MLTIIGKALIVMEAYDSEFKALCFLSNLQQVSSRKDHSIQTGKAAIFI